MVRLVHCRSCLPDFISLGIQAKHYTDSFYLRPRPHPTSSYVFMANIKNTVRATFSAQMPRGEHTGIQRPRQPLWSTSISRSIFHPMSLLLLHTGVSQTSNPHTEERCIRKLMPSRFVQVRVRMGETLRLVE